MESQKIDEIIPLIYSTEIRDAYTQGHSEHVAYYAKALASHIGLDRKECDEIYIAGLLHDVGKIGIPDNILLKPGKLEEDEYDLIKLHSIISEEIVKKLKNFSYLHKIVRYHHEDYNGSGYPDGLSGEEIPLYSRILSIVDVFDALTTGRIYRASIGFDKALYIMEMMQKDEKFDPNLFVEFMTLIKKLGIYRSSNKIGIEFEELEAKRNTFFFSEHLTNLLNRDALLALLRKSHDYGYRVSLISCNIEKFKSYNKKYGIDRGDALLKNIAKLLIKNFKAVNVIKEPTNDDIFLFRLNGDKFIILYIGSKSEFISYKLKTTSDIIKERYGVVFEYNFIIKSNVVSRNIESEIGYML